MSTTRQRFLQSLGALAAALVVRPSAAPAPPPGATVPGPATIPSGVTVPIPSSTAAGAAPGLYLITGEVTWAGGVTGTRTLALLHRGNTIATQIGVPLGDGPYRQQIATLVRVDCEADLETLELVAYQNSGGPLPLSAAPAYFRV